MPDGRTGDYAIWRACERFGILPPGVREKWEDTNVWSQAMLVAFNQIRNIEEVKEETDRFNTLIKIFNKAWGG